MTVESISQVQAVVVETKQRCRDMQLVNGSLWPVDGNDFLIAEWCFFHHLSQVNQRIKGLFSFFESWIDYNIIELGCFAFSPTPSKNTLWEDIKESISL